MRAKLGKDGALCFWCPACDNVHRCTIAGGNPWSFSGDWEKPTLSPSVLVTYRGFDEDRPVTEICHSFVREGEIQFLADCTHALAGQTVPIPEWEKDTYL